MEKRPVVDVSIKADVRKLTKHLNRVQRKQIPFAASLALNRSGQEVMQKLPADAAGYLRIKKSWMKRLAFRMDSSNKINLRIRIRIKDRQWKAYKPNIVGGARDMKRSEKLMSSYYVPAKGAKVTGGQITKVLSNVRRSGDKTSRSGQGTQDFFRATINGLDAVWKRGSTVKGRASRAKAGKSLTASQKKIKPFLIMLGLKSPRYSKRFPFDRVVINRVLRAFPLHFVPALNRALATAR